MTDHRDDLTTRAASYAVGALTDAERRDVESDLRRDRRLAAEVREFTETTALLGLSVEPVAAGSSLREALLGAIESTPQESAEVTRGPWLARPVTALIGVAAALVIVVGGVAAALTLTSVPSSPVDQIVAAADSERASVTVEGGGTVTAVWSVDLQKVALLVDDLAPLPADRTYQAWFMRADGEADAAGTFEATPGHLLSLALAGDMEPGDSIGISIEPAGGSVAPTSAPIVVIPTA